MQGFINLYWCNMNNFGDALNKHIFENVFRQKVEYSKPWDCEYVGIGSILDKFLLQTNDIFRIKPQNIFKPVNVLSSGLGWEEEYYLKRTRFFKSMIFKRKMNFISLRGKLTQRSIEKILNKKIESIMLGDLGLLASKLIEKPHYKKYDIGICPHYADYNDPIFKTIAEKNENSIIIDSTIDPIEYLNTISKCKAIISTGLHPIIAADSLGIPNLWCRISEKTTSKNKFYDYYSIYNLDIEPIYLNEQSISLKDICNKYPLDRSKVVEIQKNIYEYHLSYFNDKK